MALGKQKMRAYVYKTRKDKGAKRPKRVNLSLQDPAFRAGYLAEKAKQDQVREETQK